MNIEKKLLEIGKKDLESANKLYETEHYNIALFQFQQSVEKCVKSYGIISKIIEEKDLVKKISHLPHKVFTNQFKQKIDKLNQYENTPILIPNMIPPHQRGKDNYSAKINILEKTYNKTNYTKLSDMEKITYSEIKNFLDDAKKLEIVKIEDENKLYQDIKDDFIKTNEHFKKYFKEELNEDDESPTMKMVAMSLENPDYFSNIRFLNHKYEFEKQQKINHLIYVWFNLSIITSPHEQKTRYPSSITGKSPGEFYDKGNDLIKLFPELSELMKVTIKLYEEIYFNEN